MILYSQPRHYSGRRFHAQIPRCLRSKQPTSWIWSFVFLPEGLNVKFDVSRSIILNKSLFTKLHASRAHLVAICNTAVTQVVEYSITLLICVEPSISYFGAEISGEKLLSTCSIKSWRCLNYFNFNREHDDNDSV